MVGPNDRVQVGYRVWRSDGLGKKTGLRNGTVYGSSYKHGSSLRKNNVVKLCLELNTNRQRNNKTNSVALTYFGEVSAYFCYEVDDKKSVLAMVKLYQAVGSGEPGS